MTVLRKWQMRGIQGIEVLLLRNQTVFKDVSEVSQTSFKLKPPFFHTTVPLKFSKNINDGGETKS